jgi:hypothetical protein
MYVGGEPVDRQVEMVDDLEQALVDLRLARSLENQAPDALVQLGPLGLGNRRVAGLLQPVVREPIADRRLVRTQVLVGLADRHDDLVLQRAGEAGGRVARPHPRDDRERLEVETVADARRELHQPLCLRVEAGDPGGDQVDHVIGDLLLRDPRDVPAPARL